MSLLLEEASDYNPLLYELVTTHMIHRRCSASDICWVKEKIQCSKFLPKDVCNESSFDPEGVYPHYRRPHMEPTPEGHTNYWVVPYNPWLLKKYRTHLNVEICASIKSVFCLFKYVHKSPDQAIFRSLDQQTCRRGTLCHRGSNGKSLH
jgi:hypothetical protein